MLAADHLPLAVWWDAQLVRWVVWGGLVLITISLLLLIRTRWGQQPLGKCVVLSLVAHLLLAIYISTVNIVTGTGEIGPGRGVHVAIVGGASEEFADDALAPEQWNAIQPGQEDVPVVESAVLAPLPDAPQLEPIVEPRRESPVDSPDLVALPPLPRSEEPPAPEMISRAEPIIPPATTPAEATELAPEASTDLVPPPERTTDPVEASGETQGSIPPVAGNPAAPPDAARTGGELNAAAVGPAAAVPEIYQGRRGNHLNVGGGGNGITRESEAAVAAALRWLVSMQSDNGRWDPRASSAGSGLAADGENRQGAGAHADTALTGLSLLALLASGHTHLEGEYRDSVRRGLEFLLAVQDSTGNLGATNNLFERNYCHAMATCALSEAYAMTRDKRLLPAVTAAIGYTVRTQDRASGSWRYQAGQPGDTSQLGWQLMALRSGEIGGIAMPRETRAAIERFLGSVAAGPHGGLAYYQPTRPIATRSMTAEALACHQFLGHYDRPEATREACEFILQDPPGAGTVNHYYWYYATLALYQAQGDAWKRWNEALQRKLIPSQRTDGAFAGSWDPDPVWGRCGGRVYSTALCTLCLEVYYRYLPLTIHTAGRENDRK